MRLILDFDRVLFDHDAYQLALAGAQLEALYAHPEVWDHLDPSVFLYPDVMPFLQQYPAKSMTILSAYTARLGPEAEPYQRRKLRESGVDAWVGEVVVMDGAKAPFVQERNIDSTVFVDDKRLYVEEVTALCPDVTCIQLLRPGATRTKNDSSTQPAEAPIQVATSLAEVDAIIKTL